MQVSPGQGCCDALTIRGECRMDFQIAAGIHLFFLPIFFFLGGGGMLERFKQAENTALRWLLFDRARQKGYI